MLIYRSSGPTVGVVLDYETQVVGNELKNCITFFWSDSNKIHESYCEDTIRKFIMNFSAYTKYDQDI